MELNTYYICLLRKGPHWTSQDADELQEQHHKHNRSLVESGMKLFSGPIDDDSDIRGFGIFRTATLAEARALAEADPAVQARRFVIELHAWRTPRRWHSASPLCPVMRVTKAMKRRHTGEITVVTTSPC